MNDYSPVGVTAAYFEALKIGDVSAAMALFSPDVVWHQPGQNRFSGVHRGVEGVGALLAGMIEVSEGTFQIAVSGPLMANGEYVAVPVEFTGARASASMGMSGVDLIAVRDGKIAEVRLFSQDGDAEDAFWGAA